MLSGLENRFSRSQPIAPDCGRAAAAAARSAWCGRRLASAVASVGRDVAQRSTSGDAAVVEIHQPRRDEADGEIDRHGDDDHLDRLAGLVEHGAGENLHQVRIADGDRERRVLGQVEILAGQRRDDHPHRLRHHHEAQRRTGPQAQRIGRLGLPLGDREDAGAHHLGDEGRGVDHEPEQQRHELRQHLDAAADVEAPGLGIVELHRKAGQRQHGERQRDHEPERRPTAPAPAGRSRICRRFAQMR